MPGYRYEVSKIVSEITKLEREYQKTTEAISTIERDIKEGQDMIDAIWGESEDNSKAEVATDKVVWGAFQSLSGWFSAPATTESEEKGLSVLDRKRAEKLLRKAERRKDQLENAIKAKEKTAELLSQLRHQRETMKPPLSDETYEKAIVKVKSFQDDICGVLADHILNRYRVILERYQVLDQHTDLTRPQEWFPRTRLDQRTIIFHAGPTNSGKTYNALQRLKEAKKGLYLGPLRLLAAEVYETLTAEGIYCNLFTGQEKRVVPFATHGSATVEMALLEEDFDVVVIDEIQMIADLERGHAWTRALMGLRCKEIHVCGGAEAEPVLKKLAAACGDHLEINKYQRFSSLTVAPRSLAKSPNQLESYRNVEKGDCVVAFSRNDIFAIKREIERLTDFKCCVVYGSLPPQTRSEQARLFNDPDSGYDILVASDAIGMGLNLNIRRIVFNSIYKNDGSGIVRLGHSAVKQISGRAGRRNSVFPEGIVTCRSPDDMGYLKACMATDIAPIERAGLLPLASHLETFDLSLKQYAKEGTAGSMNIILKQFADMASIRNDYFLCRLTEMHEIAEKIDEYPLAIRDKYSLCMCPVSTRNGKSMDLLKRFAAKLSVGEVSGLSNKTIPRKARTFDDLALICNIFSEVDLFLWLQNKFPPGNYIEQQNAMALKERAIELIGEALQDTSKIRLTHCYIKRDQQVRQAYKKNQKTLKAQEFTVVDEDEWEDDDDEWDELQVRSA
jgi:ATP-dependent RNA helicase SUPV3L1/SUV3